MTLFIETAQMFQWQWNNGMELELRACLSGQQSSVLGFITPNSFILSQTKASKSTPNAEDILLLYSILSRHHLTHLFVSPPHRQSSLQFLPLHRSFFITPLRLFVTTLHIFIFILILMLIFICVTFEAVTFVER